ncbi:methyltransferase domain-containing protein [Ramlibacter sp. AW1]|uniref:Methyltransferase domain-containing protein n=1 Tax=Ramlibacter aurantiacus TaxID=2801330 RepID=A0A937D3Y6_9BURK|nr:methyltransferase domain-containing protein [Ramlibacter aurantiacus]MBL0419812.1 methyltransferase domain-containing protein [Ramlibacter aurantiacus]
MQQWLDTPPGRYLRDWEQAAFDGTVSDIFGYHALQLGLPDIEALRSNRMPHRWLGLQPDEQARGLRPHLVAESHALPFEANSLDLVVLPHSLELSLDPHATLREVERVLVPDGKVVISGLNPASLWGLRQRRARALQKLGFGHEFLPEAGEFIGSRRLRDWLRLLNFEVEAGRFGCWRPALSTEKWLARYEWMDRLGERWWPIFGAVYFVVAVKRVRGVRLMGSPFKRPRKMATAPVPVTNRGHKIQHRKDAT